MSEMGMILKKLTSAHALAAVALFVSLGGTAWSVSKIDSKDIRDNAVLSEHIKKGNVRSADIASNAVGSSELSTDSVGPPQVKPGTIRPRHLSDDSVGPPQIAPGAIRSEHLAAGIIGPMEISAGAVGSEHIKDGGIGPIDVAVGAIGSAQLGDGLVGPIDIGANAIGSGHIKDGIIAPLDIDENAILPRHIAFPIGAIGSRQGSDVLSNGGLQTLLAETLTLPHDAVVTSQATVLAGGNTDGVVEAEVLVDGQTSGVWRDHIAAGEHETVSFGNAPVALSAGTHTIELVVLAGDDDVTFEFSTLTATVGYVTPSM